MELSVVLFNCNGPNGKGNTKERVNICQSTMDSWIKHDVVPTVVLVQEAKGSIRSLWENLSSKSDSAKDCEAACYFPEIPDAEEPDVEFLKSDYLIKIKDKMHYSPGEVDVARIQCAIMTIGIEKILICSWHGKHKTKNKAVLLKNMLIFVDKIKKDKNCVAALVGGDFNLNSDIARKAMPKSVLSAVLHDDYENPDREDLIDYVIAWPSDRISLNSCRVIDTSPPQPEAKEARMFDHALTKYELIVKLEGEWEGEGDVTWRGECVEGEGEEEGEMCVEKCEMEALAHVDIKRVNGQWKGSAKKGCCRHFGEIEIKGGRNMRVNTNINGWFCVRRNKVYTLTQSDVDEVRWKGDGEVKWKSAGKVDVHIEGGGEQIVKWRGTGLVKWRGEGHASWLGGKLEKWDGHQTVKWADDQRVRWSGGGEVVFYGGKLEHCNLSGRWTPVTKSVRGVVQHGKGVLQHRGWCARERIENILEWEGRGLRWKVTGTGTGEML